VQIPIGVLKYRKGRFMEDVYFWLVNIALFGGFVFGCYAVFCLVRDPDSEIEKHG
jgi:hypothetical protein